MPIVFVHGAAIRDQNEEPSEGHGNALLENLLKDISWEVVEQHLRGLVAPAISTSPQEVTILRAYWGDVAARLAWGGASCQTHTDNQPEVIPFPFPSRSYLLTEMRQPLNRLVARFFGDMFCYLNNRGDANNVGLIPRRILDTLEAAQCVKQSTGEPIVVLSNSMGGEIIYDIVTHFLPLMPQYSDLKIDFWCSVASQIGLFEELKLFLCSSDQFSKEKGNLVPFHDRRHLGIWWNVWDGDDIVSYGVQGIIDGVDDTPFRVGQPLIMEHLGYLQNESFYRLFAQRLRTVFPELPSALEK